MDGAPVGGVLLCARSQLPRGMEPSGGTPPPQASLAVPPQTPPVQPQAARVPNLSTEGAHPWWGIVLCTLYRIGSLDKNICAGYMDAYKLSPSRVIEGVVAVASAWWSKTGMNKLVPAISKLVYESAEHLRKEHAAIASKKRGWSRVRKMVTMIFPVEEYSDLLGHPIDDAFRSIFLTATGRERMDSVLERYNRKDPPTLTRTIGACSRCLMCGKQHYGIHGLRGLNMCDTCYIEYISNGLHWKMHWHTRDMLDAVSRSFSIWAVKHINEVRAKHLKLKEDRVELAKLRNELGHSQDGHRQTREALEKTRAELEQAQADLLQTRALLDTARATITHLQADIGERDLELSVTQSLVGKRKAADGPPPEDGPPDKRPCPRRLHVLEPFSSAEVPANTPPPSFTQMPPPMSPATILTRLPELEQSRQTQRAALPNRLEVEELPHGLKVEELANLLGVESGARVCTAPAAAVDADDSDFETETEDADESEPERAAPPGRVVINLLDGGE